MLLRVALFVLLPLSSFAQASDPFGEGWQMSLSAGATVERFFTLTPRVTAADTLLFEDPLFGRFFGRPADTVSINGQHVLYWEETGLEREVRREQSLLKLLTRIKGHYRFRSGIEVSFGLGYEGFVDKERTNETEGFPDDFYYFTSETREDYLALITSGSYHFMKKKRVQPYVGITLFQGVRRFETLTRARTFPGFDEERPVSLIDRFRTNYILDFDMDLLAGVQCQVGENWSVGVEGRLGRYLIPIPTSIQLRYLFGVKVE